MKAAPNHSFVFIRVHSWLMILVLCLPAYAQMSEEELRRERVETTEELQRTESLSAAAMRASRDKRGWLFDYGYTYASSYTASDENDRQPTKQDDPDHTWDNEFNIFGVVTTVDRNTKYYVRSKTKRTDNAKIGAGTKENDIEQAKIDMAYYEHTMPGKVLKSKLTVGRHFTKVGRGIAYGLTADGFSWNTKGKKMDFTVMFLRQNPGDNNIDNLSPVSGRTKRMFYGAEYKHKFRPWLKLDLFTLWNDDRNTANPYALVAGVVQRSQFESNYYGLGTEGTVFTKLNYWSEFIMVNGKTYNSATAAVPAAKVGVNASALDLGLRYLFGGDIAPTLFGEYAFGSGDADRTGNVTSSSGGSTKGDDSAFRSFGGLSMGDALSPGLSNIRILKGGGSFKPFGRWGAARWNDMTVNLTAYTYWTYAKGGATSDPFIATAAAPSKDIGNEYDLQVSWKLFNDVSYQFKWGTFQPGPAYLSNRGHETYLKMKVSFDL